MYFLSYKLACISGFSPPLTYCICMCFTLSGRKLTWPRGSYGLPMPASGCPLIKGYPMKEGWRLHDTENKRPSNDWSLPLHFPGPFNRNDVTQRFCMKTLSTTGGRDWPEGQFCIYMKGKCPRGVYFFIFTYSASFFFHYVLRQSDLTIFGRSLKNCFILKEWGRYFF